mmetsp:Transcript_18754/g.37917  ORF Transcript_18754/g.37917 Transcript_18754/m.37917 type:complete len:90 (-) Transcript_18754:548-817(-)
MTLLNPPIQFERLNFMPQIPQEKERRWTRRREEGNFSISISCATHKSEGAGREAQIDFMKQTGHRSEKKKGVERKGGGKMKCKRTDAID